MNDIYMVEWETGDGGNGYYVRLGPRQRKEVEKLMRGYQQAGRISNLEIWRIKERANSMKEFVDTMKNSFGT